MEISSIGNKYLQESKFWEEENKKSGRTHVVIGIICNFIRLVSLIMEPYIPSTSAKINYLLGLERNKDDEIFGLIIQEAGLKNYFALLTQNSKGLRVPIPLFTEYT
jgi:methionyl-tRNA synthetase